jgi:hypothetical protein
MEDRKSRKRQRAKKENFSNRNLCSVEQAIPTEKVQGMLYGT